MTFAEKMKAKAKQLQKALVLPEGTEPRTLQAARLIKDQKIASNVVLIGNSRHIQETAWELNVNLEGIQVIQPDKYDKIDEFTEEYFQLRKHKGMTLEAAREKICIDLNFGAMMVRKSVVDGMVAGAHNSTGKVLVAAFTIIKTKPGTKCASSCFVVSLKDKSLGTDGNLIFADCATIPNPDAEQLAEIACASAESCRTFLGSDPYVSLLSFSTKGSASHPALDVVKQATQILEETNVDFTFDGELQADAALVPLIADRKAPSSPIKGKANVLVFPDLQSGNIGYKLVERLAGADAYGPILQGFAKPVSDLSRGCSIDDIITIAAITLAQAE